MLSDLSGRSAITRAIIGCAIRVHTAVGPGVYENIYYECMKYQLRDQGLRTELQRAVPIVYRDVQLSARYYVDLIVEGEVIVELKVVAMLAEIHVRQLMTYLRLTGLPVGLLINFNVPKLVDGVRRVINPSDQL